VVQPLHPGVPMIIKRIANATVTVFSSARITTDTDTGESTLELVGMDYSILGSLTNLVENVPETSVEWRKAMAAQTMLHGVRHMLKKVEEASQGEEAETNVPTANA
jgi:hypothetical protein